MCNYQGIHVQTMARPNHLMAIAMKCGRTWEEALKSQEKADRIQCRHILTAVRLARKKGGMSFPQNDLLHIVYAARYAAPDYVPPEYWAFVGASRPKAVAPKRFL